MTTLNGEKKRLTRSRDTQLSSTTWSRLIPIASRIDKSLLLIMGALWILHSMDYDRRSQVNSVMATWHTIKISQPDGQRLPIMYKAQKTGMGGP